MKMRTGNVLYCSLLLMAGLGMQFLTHNVYAWNFEEHRKLGEESFKKACSLLTSYVKDIESKEAIESIACSNSENKARLYGMWSGLSGDHVVNPKNFMSTEAERNSMSWQYYGVLATQNFEHFWPQVKNTWRKYHGQAVDSALKAKEHFRAKRKDLAVEEFRRALVYSAFADHFLQDAYSVGHSGFSRINSLQNPSLIFHDYWNNRGRLMMRYSLDLDLASVLVERNSLKNTLSTPTGKKQIWKAYGDGNISNKANEENENIIIATNTASILSVILAFSEDDGGGDFSLLADREFPVATQYFDMQSIYVTSYIGNEMKQFPILEKNCEVYKGVSTQIYAESNMCWFDLENTFAEPVYPDITVALGRSFFIKRDSKFNGEFTNFYLAYSLYSQKYTPWSPESLRIYFNVNLTDPNFEFESRSILLYREVGLNITLPNYFEGTIVSQDIDLAYAFMSEDRQHWNETIGKAIEGWYMGLNSNFDVLKAKLTVGVGAFVPTTIEGHTPEYKAQIMLGWNFGAIGGGPLNRWNRQ